LHALTPLPLFQTKLNQTPAAYASLRREREGRAREKAEPLQTRKEKGCRTGGKLIEGGETKRGKEEEENQEKKGRNTVKPFPKTT
jgi:hypothetical protein